LISWINELARLLAGFFMPSEPFPKEIVVYQFVVWIPRAIPKDHKKLHGTKLAQKLGTPLTMK
jgi:hypothetical protein